MKDRFFLLLAAWTVAAGTLLGDGTAYGWPAAIIIGAVMSAVCPWGVVAFWLACRLRSARRR